VLLINHVPMPLEPRQLERQARQTLHALGYTAPPADTVSGWSRSNSQGLVFVYLESPAPLVQAAGQDAFTLGRTWQEDASVHLDPEGRLRSLDIGGINSYSDAGAAKDPDWTPLLKAIAASAPPVASMSRRWPPGFYADTRAAWTAVIDGAPHDIEAAALRGRPVSLRVRPVGAKDELSTPASSPWVQVAFRVVYGLTMLGVPVMLAFVALRNTRLGRGDRRGATRVAGFCFAGIFISGAFQRHWSPNLSLLSLGLVTTLFSPLFFASLAWVSYVGVEPYVRRRWPALLIGWTRLLDGRAGDGLVGQALLAGVAGGTLLTGLDAAFNAVTRLADVSGVSYLYFASWNQPASVFRSAGISCFFGLVGVGVLVVGRLLFRRDWAAWLAIVILSIPLELPTIGGLPPAAAIVEAALWGLVVAAMLYRFGLLALVISLSVNFALTNAPLTLDASRWYFWQGAFVVALVLGLALWGFRNVLGKQTLLPAGALEE
jgi:hypothetical protein